MDLLHFPSKVFDEKNTQRQNTQRPITPIFFQTNKTPPEKYVVDMIHQQLQSIPETESKEYKETAKNEVRRSFGESWKYEFYNDNDVIQFFKSNPIADLPDIIEKYHSIPSGAHRADLFRYYYLYIRGGVFMDSDAMIYQPIDDVVKDYDFVSVLSIHHGTLFQGILGASPNNEIIKQALYKAYHTDVAILSQYYHYWCTELYQIVHNTRDTYKIKLYRENAGGGGYANVVDDANRTLFVHYWQTKVIPNLLRT